MREDRAGGKRRIDVPRDDRTSEEVAFDQAVAGWREIAAELRASSPASWRRGSTQKIEEIARDAERLFGLLSAHRNNRSRYLELEIIRRVAAWARQPRWDDEDGKKRVISADVDERKMHRALTAYLNEEEMAAYEEFDEEYDDLTGLPVLLPFVAREVEAQAIEAEILANQRSLKDLAPLLDDPLIRSRLRPEMWELVIERIKGIRKRKAGRRRMTNEQRRAKWPVHDAAAEVPIIRESIRWYFPKMQPTKINELADVIAEERAGIDKSGNRVADYRKRSKEKGRLNKKTGERASPRKID